MSEDRFKIYRAHKMSEWIEHHVTEWAHELVTEHFGVVAVEELSRKQIDEVIEQWEEMCEYDGTLAIGFRNCINSWENEHEEYII